MAITRATASSVIQGLPKSKSTLAGNLPILTGSYESIATVSVGSGGASSITFSSIPSTYTHLEIRSIAASVQGNDRGNSYVYARFNGDTGTTYTWHQMRGNNSTVPVGGGTNEDAIYGSDTLYAGGVANLFGASVMTILDYANTSRNKTLTIIGGFDSNSATTGNTCVILNSGMWRSTAAITSITIPSGGFNFAQNSHFALYGIK